MSQESGKPENTHSLLLRETTKSKCSNDNLLNEEPQTIINVFSNKEPKKTDKVVQTGSISTGFKKIVLFGQKSYSSNKEVSSCSTAESTETTKMETNFNGKSDEACFNTRSKTNNHISVGSGCNEKQEHKSSYHKLNHKRSSYHKLDCTFNKSGNNQIYCSNYGMGHNLSRKSSQGSTKAKSNITRKKLEVELKAAEEIAKIKETVIEKRLALELASLEDSMDHHSRKRHAPSPVPSPSPVPTSSPVCALSPVPAPSPVYVPTPARGPSTVCATTPVNTPSPVRPPSPVCAPTPVRAPSTVCPPSSVRAPPTVCPPSLVRVPSPVCAPAPVPGYLPTHLPTFPSEYIFENTIEQISPNLSEQISTQPPLQNSQNHYSTSSKQEKLSNGVPFILKETLHEQGQNLSYNCVRPSRSPILSSNAFSNQTPPQPIRIVRNENIATQIKDTIEKKNFKGCNENVNQFSVQEKYEEFRCDEEKCEMAKKHSEYHKTRSCVRDSPSSNKARTIWKSAMMKIKQKVRTKTPPKR